MKANTNYKIIPEHNLVIEYIAGSIYTKDYANLKNKLLKEPNFKSNMRYLIDITEVSHRSFLISEIIEFSNFMKSIKEKIGKERKVAIITKIPSHVVIGLSYKEFSKAITKNVELFSTYKEGLKWLKVGENIEVKNIISNLKNTF